MGNETLKNVKGNHLVISLIIYFIYLGIYIYKDVIPHQVFFSMYIMIIILFFLILILNKKKLFQKVGYKGI